MQLSYELTLLMEPLVCSAPVARVLPLTSSSLFVVRQFVKPHFVTQMLFWRDPWFLKTSAYISQFLTVLLKFNTEAATPLCALALHGWTDSSRVN